MVCEAVSAVRVVLSVTVGVMLKELGGGEGTVPVMVMLAPVVPLGESHAGRPAKVQLYPGVPPDAVQVAEYVAPVTTCPVGATQLIFSLETTAIAMVCAAVCAVGVVVSVAVAVKLYEPGGGAGTVPVNVMVAPLVPAGRKPRRQIRKGPSVSRGSSGRSAVTEYWVPATTDPVGAAQLTLSLGLTEIAMVCDADSCVTVSITTAVKLY